MGDEMRIKLAVAVLLFSTAAAWNRVETTRNVYYKDHVITISPTYNTKKMFPQSSELASELPKTYVIHFDFTKAFALNVREQMRQLLKVDDWVYVPSNTFIVFTTEKLLIELAEKNPQVVWFDEMRPEWKSSTSFKSEVASGQYVERANTEGAKQSLTPFDTVKANIHCTPTPSCILQLIYLWNAELMNITGYGNHIRMVPDLAIYTYTMGINVKFFTEYLSSKSEVQDIAFAPLNQLFLETSNTYLQGSNTYPLWTSFTGENEIIGVIDSGLDYRSCYFEDQQRIPKLYDWVVVNSGNSITPKDGFDPADTLAGWTTVYNPPYTHRKIVGYDVFNVGTEYSKDATDLVSGHGTHVCGCCCGRDLGSTNGRGSAFGAKIFFSDIGVGEYNSNPGTLQILAPHLQMVRAYLAGARIHTNSWGNNVEKFNDEQPYNDQTRKVDLFALSFTATLVLFAAGNSGAASSIASPGFGLNVLTVGSIDARSANPERSSFSSYGPTMKFRIKPDVVGPGSSINAAKSSGTTSATSPWLGSGIDQAFAKQPPMNTCSREIKSGTSMATPTVAGIAALVRQYFKSLTPTSATQIFNMTGSNLVNVISPPSFTGNTLKAVLVASASKTNAEIPNFQVGFGAVRADVIIQPENKGCKMFIIQSALTADNYGSFSMSIQFTIKPSTSNFKAVLTWMDIPPEADTFRPRWVNHDLDLTVYSSAQTNSYKGNGQDVYDSINNVEMVYFPSATAQVTVSVRSKLLSSDYNRNYQWSASSQAQWTYPIDSLPVTLVVLGPIESATPTVITKGCPSNCSGAGVCSTTGFGCVCNTNSVTITNTYNHPLYYHEDCTLNLEIPFPKTEYLFLCPMVKDPTKLAYIDSTVGNYVENPLPALTTSTCGPSSCILYNVATASYTCVCLNDDIRGRSVKSSSSSDPKTPCTCTGSVYDIADNGRCLYSSKSCSKGTIQGGKCICNPGFTGTTCNTCVAGLGGTNCNCLVVNGLECGGRGKCTADGCICDVGITTGFHKSTTSIVSTTSGNVVASNCICKDGFTGKYCMCSSDCGGHGTCSSDDSSKRDTCKCLDLDTNINDGHWQMSNDTSAGYKCTECANGWGPRSDNSLCRTNLALCSGKHTPLDIGCLCAFNTNDGFWMPAKVFTNKTRSDVTLTIGNTVRYIPQNAVFGAECTKCYQDDVDRFIPDTQNQCKIPVPASKGSQCGKGTWNPSRGRCDCASDSIQGFWRTLQDATGVNFATTHTWGVVNHYSCVTCTSNYLANKDATGVQTNCKCILTSTGRCGKGTCIDTATEQGCRCFNDPDLGYWDVSTGTSQSSVPGVNECNACSPGAGVAGSCKCRDSKCGGNGVCTTAGCTCNAGSDRGYWASRTTSALATYYSAAVSPASKGETNPLVFGYLTGYTNVIQQTCDTCAPGYSTVSTSCKNNDFLCNDLTADTVIATLGVSVDIDSKTKSDMTTAKSRFLACNVNASDPNYPSLSPPVQSSFISGTQFYLSVSQAVALGREFYTQQATNATDYNIVKKTVFTTPIRVRATLGSAVDSSGGAIEVDTSTYQLMQFDKSSNSWIATCQDSTQDGKADGSVYSANICSITEKQLFAVFAKNKIKSYKLIIIIASAVGAFVIIVLLMICIICMQKKLKAAKKEKERKEVVVKYLLENRHEHKKQLRYKLKLKPGQAFTPELAAARILKYHEIQQDKLKKFIATGTRQSDAPGGARFEFRDYEWELLEAAKRVKLMFSSNPWTREFASRPNALNELQAGVSELYNENEKLKRVLGSLKQQRK